MSHYTPVEHTFGKNEQLQNTETLEQVQPYLGPAVVNLILDKKLLLTIDGVKTWATLALSQTYRPIEGDIVLAIRQTSDVFVIGVIQGKGKTVITSLGDIELNAPRGKIKITAKEGIELSSQRIRVFSNQLEMVAEALHEHFTDACRVVKNTYTVNATNILTAVKDTFCLKSRRIRQRASDEVKIDGNKIKLG